MDWLNLHVSTLDSEEFLGEPPDNQGTWLKLQRYCIGQENGGIIRGIGRWKNRKLEQILRITETEIRQDSALWTWTGDDLTIFAYPLDKETIVRSKREIARENGKLGGRPVRKPKSKPTRKPTLEPILKPISVPTSEPMSEPISESGREVEGKGKGSGKESLSARGAEESVRIPDIIAIYPKREKDHDATLELARQIERGEVDLETVAAGTRAIAAIIPRLSGGHLNRYVPSALAFFRDRRWQDDPQTWLRNAPATRNGAPAPEELDLGGRRGTTVKISSTTTP